MGTNECRPKFKVGDRVKVITTFAGNYLIGKTGTVCGSSLINGIGVEFDEYIEGHSCDGKCKSGHGRYGSEDELELITNNKPMIKSITKFVKEMVLSADEKLLRKFGLKDECGDWTDEAEDAVTRKLLDDNAAYLLTIAKGMEKEEKEEKAVNK